MHKQNADRAKNVFSYLLLAVSAILITVTGIIFEQKILLMIPLYVSLVVGLLQSRANRFAFLLGGANCIIYTVAYLIMGLYGQAFSTLLWSCPIQLVTFWQWNRRSYKHSTEFKRLGPIHWLLGGVAFIVSFIVLRFVLTSAEGSYRTLDSLITIVGFIVSLLSMFSYREYSWLMLVTCALNLTLFLVMTLDDPAQSTYLVYAVNSMICVIMQFFSVRKLYAEQKREKEVAHA